MAELPNSLFLNARQWILYIGDKDAGTNFFARTQFLFCRTL